MNRKNLLTATVTVLLALTASIACATPPYDVIVEIDDPSGAPAPDGYNFYIDDCDATGPTGAPFAAVTDGQTFTEALTANGVFTVCVRSFNTKPDPAVNFCEGEAVDVAVAICEFEDPGPAVETFNVAELLPTPFPAPADEIRITITGGSGSYTVTIIP